MRDEGMWGVSIRNTNTNTIKPECIINTPQPSFVIVTYIVYCVFGVECYFPAISFLESFLSPSYGVGQR